MNKPTTVLVGGKAGEGVKKAAQVIATSLFNRGWHVFQADDYQSLIKGGHNFSQVSFAREPVHNAYTQADLLISFDKRSFEQHRKDTTSSVSLHCYDSDVVGEIPSGDNGKYLGLPFSRLMKQIYGEAANVSLSAVALFYCWMNYCETELDEVIRKEFKRNVEDNVRYAREIYRQAQVVWETESLPHFADLFPEASKTTVSEPANESGTSKYRRFSSGNQALALGAWAAGLDFYYAYPMTPASSILHYLALKQKTHRVYAIHAESELAAANLAIGSVVAGARTAVGSSGGGFALMQEAFSLAGISEAPLLCILASRPGPATGVSTYTAQEDLFFALHQGHGEFGRVVAAPDCITRAFSLAAELLSLAWEFQSPVILLTDKHLSESSCDLVLPKKVPYAEAVRGETTPDYQRYEITETGVSPLLFPGNEDTVIKWNSHEHLPSGLRTDKAEAMVSMKDKRNRKSQQLALATQRYNRVQKYGNSGMAVFAYGSAVLELREALKHCPIPFTIVALIYLLPFPAAELQEYEGQEIIVLEHSSNGNLAQYLQQQLNVKIKKSLLRYDGRPYAPLELAAELKELL